MSGAEAALAVALLAAAGDDAAADAAYERAVALRRDGSFKAAVEAFEAIAERWPKSGRASRALTSAAEIHQWQLGDVRRATELYDRVLSGPDAAPGTVPALEQRLFIERERGGARAELALVRKLYDARPSSERSPRLLLRAAEILDADLSRPAEALAALARLVESFPSSSKVDEARLRQAALLRRLGRPRDAIAALRAIVEAEEKKERSVPFAPYMHTSAFLDDARFLIAETLETDLRDLEAAERAYRRVIEESPESRLAGDARARAAKIASERAKARGAR